MTFTIMYIKQAVYFTGGDQKKCTDASHKDEHDSVDTVDLDDTSLLSNSPSAQYWTMGNIPR